MVKPLVSSHEQDLNLQHNFLDPLSYRGIKSRCLSFARSGTSFRWVQTTQTDLEGDAIKVQSNLLVGMERVELSSTVYKTVALHRCATFPFKLLVENNLSSVFISSRHTRSTTLNRVLKYMVGIVLYMKSSNLLFMMFPQNRHSCLVLKKP